MAADKQITVLWAAKGGSGTTVTTAAAAVNEPGQVVIVDLQGDMTDVFAAELHGGGLDDWLLGEPSNHLQDLVVDIDETTRLLPSRSPIDLDQVRHRRVEILERWMRAADGNMLVDAGTGQPAEALVEIADRNLLVTRACYLGLMKGVRVPLKPDGIVLLREPSRSLNASAVERSLGAPIVATIDVHPSIARSVDAGLLTAGQNRLKRSTTAITQPERERSAVDEWRDLDPRRHSPDVDYGMQWRKSGSHDRWRVSWNTGSGALYVTNIAETKVDNLGTFDTESDVASTLGDWTSQHERPDGLDMVRTAVESPAPIAKIPGPML